MPAILQVDAPTALGIPSRSSLEGQRCGSRNDRNGGQIARSLIPCLFFPQHWKGSFLLLFEDLPVCCPISGVFIALAHVHNKSA